MLMTFHLWHIPEVEVSLEAQLYHVMFFWKPSSDRQDVFAEAEVWCSLEAA